MHSTQKVIPHQEQDYTIFIAQIFLLFIFQFFQVNVGTVATNPDYIYVGIKGR
jgi:hypothetical protein